MWAQSKSETKQTQALLYFCGHLLLIVIFTCFPTTPPPQPIPPTSCRVFLLVRCCLLASRHVVPKKKLLFFFKLVLEQCTRRLCLLSLPLPASFSPHISVVADRSTPPFPPPPRLFVLALYDSLPPPPTPRTAARICLYRILQCSWARRAKGFALRVRGIFDAGLRPTCPDGPFNPHTPTPPHTYHVPPRLVLWSSQP